jgi:hypothetical protein
LSRLQLVFGTGWWGRLRAISRSSNSNNDSVARDITRTALLGQNLKISIRPHRCRRAGMASLNLCPRVAQQYARSY